MSVDRSPAQGQFLNSSSVQALTITPLTATTIGEFVRYNSCERRFKLDYNQREIGKSLPFAERLFSSLDPVLTEMGKDREDAWEDSLLEKGLQSLVKFDRATRKHRTFDEVAPLLKTMAIDNDTFVRELAVEGTIGFFAVSGRIDFLVIRWRDGQPRILITECKASRRDRTYQRIQASIYLLILRQLAREKRINIAGTIVNEDQIEAVVVRVDELTRVEQSILDAEPLQLNLECADVERLMSQDGLLHAILETKLEDVPYAIEPKCDACVFNVNCLPWSANRRRPELLGFAPSLVRTLREHGVHTIDDVADLNLDGETAAALRASTGLTEPLERMKTLARVRRTNLTNESDPEEQTYSVEQLRNSGFGQLPLHEQHGTKLTRVFLSIEYDYTEDRVGALSAHITNSDGRIHTQWRDAPDGRREPDPQILEQIRTGTNAAGFPTYGSVQPLVGVDLVEIVQGPWAHDLASDNATERQLLSSFFSKVVDAISERSDDGHVILHIYVWNKSDIRRLVEACARGGTGLLNSLHELLGCREGLEQIIFSSLQDEVDSRFALGWTGRGLGVVTTLSWFGRRFHWTRTIGGRAVPLDRVFTQDIFDFKTTLDIGANGDFVDVGTGVRRDTYEIRTRFSDSLTAPYWRAFWGVLQAQPSMNALTKSAVKRYNAAAGVPGYLSAYLRERVHALRWIEESITGKNRQLTKARIAVADLPQFSLNVVDVGRAGLDFIRLDHHIRVQSWIAEHLSVPADRIARGRTLPLRNVIDRGGRHLEATIDEGRFQLSLPDLQRRTTFSEGSFVRLSPAPTGVAEAQNVGDFLNGGRTCTVTAIDWATGSISLDVISSRGGRYIFPSYYNESADTVLMAYATLDESLSDFVSGRVDNRLQARGGDPILRWFDPQHPQIPRRVPITPDQSSAYAALLRSLEPEKRNQYLDAEQQLFVLNGLFSTVQLLQGPPGTGKTTTTASSVLLRALHDCQPGDMIVLSGNTHTAVDTLLGRLAQSRADFLTKATAEGFTPSPVALFKLHSSNVTSPFGDGVIDLSASAAQVADLGDAGRTKVLIVGGTPSSLLKWVANAEATAVYRGGLPVRHLIIDEASMLLLPYFLAITTVARSDAAIFLAGDHRQLAPIVAHDWGNEDRPPILAFQPFVSSYQAIDAISKLAHVQKSSVRVDRLSTSYRLPAAVVDLLDRLYSLDNVQLRGLYHVDTEAQVCADPFSEIWRQPSGIFLIVHDERRSRESNAIEASIIKQIIDAGVELDSDCIAVITPHRAQRTMLNVELASHIGTNGCIRIVDTVEKIQGGECDNIIVSGTVSDPSAIASTPEFYLSLNRANVAFSRTKKRLIVVCSSTLLDHIPPDQDDYASALLWKTLREICCRSIGEVVIAQTQVRVLVPETPNRVLQSALDRATR